MNLKIAVFFFLFSAAAYAQSQSELFNLQIYVPGIQMRFEEGSDQQQDVRDYTHYAIHLMYDKFLSGVEYNTSEDTTGNASLNVKATVKEWNLLAGWSLVKFDFPNLTTNTNVEFLVEGFYGNSKTQIRTSLLGSSQSDESEEKSVLGVGGLALFRLDYFIAAFDTRWMQSEAYTPSSVSVTSFKLGVNFRF